MTKISPITIKARMAKTIMAKAIKARAGSKTEVSIWAGTKTASTPNCSNLA